jgi:hypothetical protein
LHSLSLSREQADVEAVKYGIVIDHSGEGKGIATQALLGSLNGTGQRYFEKKRNQCGLSNILKKNADNC